MGRQANFSELRDAIRQGQAKIAQGLKTGQMRSDRNKGNRAGVPRLDPAHEVLGKKPTLTAKSAIFQKRQKSGFRFSLPKLPKIRVRLPRIPLPPMQSMVSGVVVVLGVGLVVFVVFWIGKALTRPRPDTPPVSPADVQTRPVEPAPSAPVVTRQDPVIPSGQVRSVPAPVQPAPVVPTPPAAAGQTGNNVIVIQGIASSREGELAGVQAFFAQHGIATEIIRGGNNYSRLVTRDRFENPNRPGTDGYEMRMRIRNLGKRYPVETGDTKFGTEPFQDAYGLLRQ